MTATTAPTPEFLALLRVIRRQVAIVDALHAGAGSVATDTGVVDLWWSHNPHAIAREEAALATARANLRAHRAANR